MQRMPSGEVAVAGNLLAGFIRFNSASGQLLTGSIPVHFAIEIASLRSQ